ncbi:MAG TPA: hypothetical protein VL522_07605 [Bordetella sp.]|nr:hypothetical protein [Bordetella sp.]
MNVSRVTAVPPMSAIDAHTGSTVAPLGKGMSGISQEFENYGSTNVLNAGLGRGKREATPLAAFLVRFMPTKKDEFSSKHRSYLDTIVEQIEGLSVETVNIIGFERMSPQTGELRATAVKEYLVEKGLDPKLIVVSGQGPSAGADFQSLGRDACVMVAILGSSE